MVWGIHYTPIDWFYYFRKLVLMACISKRIWNFSPCQRNKSALSVKVQTLQVQFIASWKVKKPFSSRRYYWLSNSIQYNFRGVTNTIKNYRLNLSNLKNSKNYFPREKFIAEAIQINKSFMLRQCVYPKVIQFFTAKYEIFIIASKRSFVFYGKIWILQLYPNGHRFFYSVIENFGKLYPNSHSFYGHAFFHYKIRLS